jgi:hypothetical protein
MKTCAAVEQLLQNGTVFACRIEAVQPYAFRALRAQHLR